MKKAADILRNILGEQEARQAGEWSAFFKGWQALAGDDIAAHSSVKDVKQGVVIVEVDHPGWLQMLQMKKGTILRNMKRRYPELDIKDIRIFLGTGVAAAPVDDNHRDKRRADDPVNDTGETAEDVENTQEYLDFKKMLKRLRKGQPKSS